MSKVGLDNRHRNHDGEISHKHGNTLVRTLRQIYGQRFATGYPETEKLSEILLHLNETSLSQVRRDHETGQLEHKIANASNGEALTFDASSAVADVGRNSTITRLFECSEHRTKSRHPRPYRE